MFQFITHPITPAILMTVCCVSALGCSKNNKPDTTPPDTVSDMSIDLPGDGISDQTISDMTADSAGDMSKDIPGTQLPQTCNGTCSANTAEVTYNTQKVSFDRATFGLLAASRTSSGAIELQIEAYIGGADGCPSMNSPTPKQTLIISGITVPSDKTPITEKTASIKLIDYDSGLLKDSLFVDATALTLTPVASKICTTCLSDDKPDLDSFIALDVDVTFDKGNIKGRLYAKHCDSMDAK